MMLVKLKLRNILPVLLLVLSPGVFAQEDAPGADPDDKVAQYLQNLGKYFGYDLTQYCTAPGACQSMTPGAGGTEAGAGAGEGEYNNRLIDLTTTNLNELSVFYRYIGALLNTPLSDSATQTIVSPNPATPYSILNSKEIANQTFMPIPYLSPAKNKVSVSDLIDQETWQPDPVSQGVLNIVSTPDSSYCMKDNKPQTDAKCQYLNTARVMSQVIGELPRPDVFFTTDYTRQFLSQLNINTLLTPLMYSTEDNSEEASNSPGASPNENNNQKNKGLQAKTQAQQAANFIRYATGMVSPVALANQQDYASYYTKATNADGKTPSVADQRSAGAVLTAYLTRLRSYAAQNSVAISNLYYILSKRMPQTPSGNQGKPTSQALEEFKMATWRIYNPAVENAGQNQKQWLDQLNKASSATVQKEIAVLLAEINYQMYLTRQQQERQLLVQTIILMQNARIPQAQPILFNVPGSLPAGPQG